MDNYFKIAQLIAESLTGTLSDEEIKILEKWRTASPENEKSYHDLLDSKYRKSERELYYSFDSTGVLENVLEDKRKSKRRAKFIRMTRIASAACLLMVAGVMVYLTQNDKEAPKRILCNQYNNVELLLSDGSVIDLASQNGQLKVDDRGSYAVNTTDMLTYDETQIPETDEIIYNVIKVNRGNEYKLQLSDGTLVYLNAGTRIKYPVRFTGDIREVEVEGEALFQVAHDSEHPFIVNVQDYSITVLGTEFNVSNYSEDPLSRTVLIGGSVRITAHGTEYTLTPDQAFVLDRQNSKTYIEQVDAEYYAAWKDGKFRFYEERLDVIMNTIARWYDINVEYDDESLRELDISLFANRRQSIDPLIKVFNEHGIIKIEKYGETLKIKKGR